MIFFQHATSDKYQSEELFTVSWWFTITSNYLLM